MHRSLEGKFGQTTAATLPRSVYAMLLTVLVSPAAHAALSDTIHPFGSINYSHDDNLFRLSDNLAPPDGSRSDTYRQALVGVQLERPIGRQVLSASASISRVNFDHNSTLDYNGKEASLNWQWQLGNQLSGTLGTTYSQTLTPFGDFHSNDRNIRTQRSNFFETKWLVVPSWQVRGRVNKNKSEYELLARRQLDRDVDGSEAGFDYLASTGSSVGLQVRRERAAYPFRQLVGGGRLNEAYTEQSASLRVFWKLNELTDVLLLVGRAKRDYRTTAISNSSGANGKLIAHWAPLATVNVTATLSRDFEPFEGDFVTYSLSRNSALSANWTPLSKVRLEARYSRRDRDFKGPIVVLQPGSQDSSRTGSLGVNYQFSTHVSVGASAYQDKRSTNSVFSNNYRANGASINLSMQF